MLYLDPSALIKHYIREAGTEAVNLRLRRHSFRHTRIFISTLGYAEILAAFARRYRENLMTESEAAVATQKFLSDWPSELSHVELNVTVLLFVPRLISDYPLRGSDAIHLASALWVRDSVLPGTRSPTSRSVTFASSDKQLKLAARAEGLNVFDPEKP